MNQDFSYISKVNSLTKNGYRLDFFFNLILDILGQIVEFEAAFFMLLEERLGLMAVKAYKGLEEDIVRDLKVKINSGISGKVVARGESFLGSIEDNDPRLLSREGDYWLYKNKAVLSVALNIQERNVGVINLFRPIEKKAFTNKDLEIVKALAVYAAQALEKSELYKEIDYILARLQAVQNKYGHYEGR